jgi:hypothetical protein
MGVRVIGAPAVDRRAINAIPVQHLVPEMIGLVCRCYRKQRREIRLGRKGRLLWPLLTGYYALSKVRQSRR